MLIFIVAFLFYFPCIVLFTALNKSVLKLLVPIQKLTSNLKRKELISILILFAIIAIISSLNIYFKIDDVYYGLFFGFFTALHNVIFFSSVTVEK